MKFLGIDFGSQRPSESDLKDIVAESDAKLNQASTLIYSPNDTGMVDLNDLAKGSEPGIPEIPDSGFTHRPVLGGTKPW